MANNIKHLFMCLFLFKMEQKCVANGPVEGKLDDIGDTGALHVYSVTLSSVFLLNNQT